jgi:hypothetical protein
LAKAKNAHDLAKNEIDNMKKREDELRIERGKSDKTRQDKIDKELEAINKDRDERIKNLDTLAEAHKAAEKIVRDKALKKFKSSKSDKDKMWEMIQKAQKKKEEDDKKKKRRNKINNKNE